MFLEVQSLFLNQLHLSDMPWWLLLAAFFCGVLASLSPCVYPLVPITLASFGNQHHSNISRPIYYCLGFATLYALLGWFAATTGSLFGQVASHPIVLVAFANFLLYFAAVLKGWLPLPAIPLLQFNHQPNAFLMGATSGLVAAPCTSPVLAGLLLFVAQQQHGTFAALLLFCFALGMSALLLLVAMFSTRIPKSGPWLKIAPNIFALLLIVMAQFYLLKAGQSLFI
ncbi:hypothetical protein PA25_32380 [Pseudoalteromonas sp. A25]|uniref:cytochrome c biogenesis protein CcdA n=1 Tax=Pseudoalteromonas sp. A25 TaxID=116092 RepID=UPI001260D7C2|nr:cytochrome c biogenesis protein CcdA [Pseudoalteromonas sp. A25]BBN83253.1 hypothetical protein PA25_32380 [Pseudoalteromonas sp. A25]